MIKAALLAVGMLAAIPALAQAQSATSSTPGQSGSRSMMQGSAGTMNRSGMDMQTGAKRPMMHSRSKMKNKKMMRRKMNRSM